MNLSNVITKRYIIGNNPTDNRELIHIAFGIDENFALGMGVLMTSILMHNKGKYINFHVFTDKLMQIDIGRLTQLVKKYGSCLINIYYVNSGQLKDLPAWYIWTIAAWYRFLIPLELYGNVDYVWYLDSDELCLNEIKAITLDAKMILGACHADIAQCDKKRVAKLMGKEDVEIFYSGGIYINVNNWIKNDTTVKAFKAVLAEPHLYKYADGEALLKAVQDKWQIISKEYNYVYNLVENSTEIPENIVFIHFAGTAKPWQEWAQDNSKTKLWMRYKDNSPWQNAQLQRPKTYKQAKFMLRTMKRTHKISGCIKWFVLYILYKIREKI